MMCFKMIIEGLYVFDLERNADQRGYLAHTFDKLDMERLNISFPISRVILSHNEKRGTLRGMHFQVGHASQSKLVSVTRGSIWDAVVDLRPESTTYRMIQFFELKANERMVHVPKGCAHGFITLEDYTDVLYQMDGYYAKDFECGIRWDDPSFNIPWPTQPTVISDKDKSWSLFSDTVLS